MREIINKVKNEVELFLKNNEEHNNKIIDCILINQETKETITIASDNEELILFAPYTKEQENGYMNISDWDFNFDGYIFEDLEKDYQIGFMSDNMHYGIWQALDELYPEDIDNKNGVQKYLQFCADNGITKKYLDEKLKLDTVDVMKYFEGLALFETMEYKGYVIEADDINEDNDKENLVNIYETKENYDKKEPIETISLNTIGLKQNIKDYIDEFYIDKNVIDKEKAYFTFVIGYDLLNDDFKSSPSPECDLTYGFCNKIAEDFIHSEQYQYNNCSSYEMLEKYINDNKFKILKDYERFIGAENVYFEDNKKLLEIGNRGEQPVALIEWGKGNRKEYVIAIDYTIDNDKLYWSRGYYYMDNNKAKMDFNRVKNGEYLPIKDNDRGR